MMYQLPPGVFDKVGPANGAVNQNLSVTISWNPSAYSTGYQYCVYKTGNPVCADDAWIDNGTATSKVLTGLAYNTTYYWQVRAVNAGGKTNANSTTTFWSFKTKAQPVVVQSTGAQDGWVLESSESSNAGGATDSTAITLRLGDDASKKQYRSILSFTTGASLPDDAVITKVTLKVKKSGVIGGGNPVTMFQGFRVDIKKGFFGTLALQASDFQATAHKTFGPFTPALSGGWYSIDLTSGKGYLNKLETLSGLTQIRLRFGLDDNNNTVANYLSLFSGNAPATSRPQLIIEYYVP
jgi:hypothetical protein